MKKIRNIFSNFQWVVVFAVVFTSCKEDPADELSLSRRFKPAAFDITSGETSAIIEWSPSLFTLPGEVEYQIEVSETPEFANLAYGTSTTASAITILDTEIEVRQVYFARVRAKGANGTGDSNWLVSEPFQITGEIFILPIAESDVVTDQALIRWQAEGEITSITLTPVGGVPVEVVLTGEESAAGEKLVEGLQQNTSYKAEIFREGVPKGSVTFKTKPSWVDHHIINLTGITGKPSILADTLPDIPSGSVVLLKRGEKYDIASFDFDKSVTITSGADFVATLATIEISNSFNIAAASNIDSLVFRDVNVTGLDYAGDYAFNISREGSINRVVFDNVRGHRLRGLFRMQTGGAGTQVQNFIVNNCVLDSLREYAVAWTNNSNVIANILISNSTVYKARRVISHSSPGSNSIVIEDCTFNDAPAGGPEAAEPNYFIDLASNTSANAIIIRNTIIGRGWNEGGGDFVRGVRTGGTAVNAINTYLTSDHLSTNATYQISSAISYPVSSTSLFADPENGDFRVVAGGFPGADNAGDPRWRE